jgi:hypothetical protein
MRESSGYPHFLSMSTCLTWNSDIGAHLSIETRGSFSANSGAHRTYGQLMREYRAGPEEWKEIYEYKWRSLVEIVFSMMKFILVIA